MIPHTYTQIICILIHHFHLFYTYPFIFTYSWPFMPSHVKYIHTKNDVICLQSFDDTHLALILLFHLIITPMSWLQPRKGDLHFILSENSNYDFNVRVERCRFVGFINDVIDCRCSGCIFHFKIKGKEKDTFYINFYFIMFLQSCCYFFFSHSLIE